jgi:hypothetical protein
VVRHRRGLVHDRKVIQQRLHEQLNALAPGLSAPAGHGRSLALEQPSGQAVLACAAAFAGRAPTVRSLRARATGRLTAPTRSTGRSGGVAACHPGTTLSSGRNGWPPTSPDSRHCRRRRRARGRAGTPPRRHLGQVLTSVPGWRSYGPLVCRAQPPDQPLPRRRPPVLRHRSRYSPL